MVVLNFTKFMEDVIELMKANKTTEEIAIYMSQEQARFFYNAVIKKMINSK